MTPKQLREAVLELRDMAVTLENRSLEEHDRAELGQRLQRASLLRDVATELERIGRDSL